MPSLLGVVLALSGNAVARPWTYADLASKIWAYENRKIQAAYLSNPNIVVDHQHFVCYKTNTPDGLEGYVTFDGGTDKLFFDDQEHDLRIFNAEARGSLVSLCFALPQEILYGRGFESAEARTFRNGSFLVKVKFRDQEETSPDFYTCNGEVFLFEPDTCPVLSQMPSSSPNYVPHSPVLVRKFQDPDSFDQSPTNREPAITFTDNDPEEMQVFVVRDPGIYHEAETTQLYSTASPTPTTASFYVPENILNVCSRLEQDDDLYSSCVFFAEDQDGLSCTYTYRGLVRKTPLCSTDGIPHDPVLIYRGPHGILSFTANAPEMTIYAVRLHNQAGMEQSGISLEVIASSSNTTTTVTVPGAMMTDDVGFYAVNKEGFSGIFTYEQLENENNQTPLYVPPRLPSAVQAEEHEKPHSPSLSGNYLTFEDSQDARKMRAWLVYAFENPQDSRGISAVNLRRVSQNLDTAHFIVPFFEGSCLAFIAEDRDGNVTLYHRYDAGQVNSKPSKTPCR